jgi:surface carbohydrate biosynthesis protein
MAKIRNRKWFFFPMEILSRELLSRLLIASELMGKGHVAVFGPRGLLEKAGGTYPAGVILFKDMTNREEQFRLAKKRGNAVTVISEEGLVYPSAEVYVNRRIEESSWELIDRFYAWGEKEADDITTFRRDDRNIIRVSGNPRFDILKHKEMFRRSENEYVLISSSLGHVNPVTLKAKKPNVASAEKKYSSVWELYHRESKEYFQLLIDFVRKLGEKGDIPVVFRPHPEENAAFWEEMCKEFSNVRVDASLTADDWIAGAGIVVHNNSTTGLEAFAMGVPTLCLGKKERGGFESLSNNLSMHAEDPDIAVKKIYEFYEHQREDGNFFTQEKKALLSRSVKNYNTGHTAFEDIAGDMENLVKERHPYHIEDALSRIHSFESWLYRVSLPFAQSNSARQKFPGLDYRTLKSSIEQLSIAFLGIHMHDYTVVCPEKNTWILYKK